MNGKLRTLGYNIAIDCNSGAAIAVQTITVTAKLIRKHIYTSTLPHSNWTIITNHTLVFIFIFLQAYLKKKLSSAQNIYNYSMHDVVYCKWYITVQQQQQHEVKVIWQKSASSYTSPFYSTARHVSGKTAVIKSISVNSDDLYYGCKMTAVVVSAFTISSRWTVKLDVWFQLTLAVADFRRSNRT